MTARRHHFISQCYLAGFAVNRRKPRLFVVDAKEKRSFTTSIENIGVERDFHTVEIEGVAPDAIETKLAEFEGEVAGALRRIITARSIADHEDLGKVIELMALFAARSPARRENWRRTEERVLKMVMDLASATPERWASQMRRAKADGFVPADAEPTYDDMRAFVERDSYKITFATHHHLELEFKSWQTLAGLLARRQWSLMRAPPGRTGFVTTDHPVSLMWSDDVNKRGFYGPGYGLAKTTVLFPLSNELALRGAFEAAPRVCELAERGVAMVNGTVIIHADKQVYAAAADFGWAMQHTAGRVMRGSELLADQIAGPPPEMAEAR